MAANHRIIEIGKSENGTFHYHLKRGANILMSAAGYNAKASLVKTVGHMFGLSDEQKAALTHYNMLNLDTPVPAVEVGVKKPAVPVTAAPELFVAGHVD